MSKTRCITLLTDFGTAGPYVAAMKGVILSRCPRARLVDLSHDVPAHDVLAGAFVLAHAAPYYPPGTIHVVVVDPGVGTDRAILAARLGGHLVVLPDNGVITFLQERLALEEIVTVRNPRYLPPRPSATFHGRDIFAPLACLLHEGVALERLGPRPERYKLLDVGEPVREGGQLRGTVIHMDRFGNLITNIPGRMVQAWDAEGAQVFCNGRPVGPLRPAYGAVAPGEPLAIVDSMDLLEVAVNQGRASEHFQAGCGAEVRVVRA